jgi:glycerol uptake facilitator-like aquaporin
MNLDKYLVEFFGTFVFLYVIISTGHPLAIGGILAFCIFLGGKISGGNFNPAVTIMMAAAKKLPTTEVVPYIIAQVAGGLLALELYKRI